MSQNDASDPDRDDAPRPGGAPRLPGVDGVAPSAALLATLERIDLGGCDASATLSVLAAADRLANRAEGLKTRALARFGQLRQNPNGTLKQFACDEVAPELGITAWAANTQLHDAVDLAERLPRTLAAVEAGPLCRE